MSKFSKSGEGAENNGETRNLRKGLGDNTSAMVGSRTWFGEILHRAGVRRYSSDKFIDFPLSPLQEQRLKKLKGRMHTSFDPNRADHQVALKALWRAAFPNVQLNGLISEQWKDMGWQGSNPSTDFRYNNISHQLASIFVVAPAQNSYPGWTPALVQQRYWCCLGLPQPGLEQRKLPHALGLSPAP
ncbi:hypothetical protein Cgig2_020935 [Carnegiea gigantea]|uniref:ELMO domain-containing protein n=1 Tax=Carnegiea gigantea TaxID=171969 RepID=A0A9Q1JJZ8_9CARY|nr:hypothetical protein Cgig2_020935 [Carnegiea gigantea]